MQKMHIANSDKPVKFIDFRKWATTVLKKYLVDGYAVNENKINQTKSILNKL